MPSEFIQRQIDSLLAEAAQAIRLLDWRAVGDRAPAVRRLDPDNEDARALLAAAEREPGEAVGSRQSAVGPADEATGNRQRATDPAGPTPDTRHPPPLSMAAISSSASLARAVRSRSTSLTTNCSTATWRLHSSRWKGWTTPTAP